MRVVLATHYFPEHRSGVELIAGELARRLAVRGVELTWFAAAPCTEPLGGRIEAAPVAAWNGVEERLGIPYPLWTPGGYLRLWRALRGADLLHLHECLYLSNVAAALMARRLRKPVVLTQHIGPIDYANPLPRLLMRGAYRSLGAAVFAAADARVYYSRTAESWFRTAGLETGPIRRIANGVDLSRFCPLPEMERRALRASLGWPTEGPALLFVGRFVEKKGLGWVRELATHRPDCGWLLIGRGPLRPESWGLPNVRCVGSLPQEAVARYYQAADLLVLPSFGEGFPLVIQEAMACGTPCLTSLETAAAEPGARPLLMASRLSAPELRAALDSFVSAGPPRTREQVAAHARRAWDWERAADAYHHLYQETAAQARCQRPIA